MGKFSIIDSIPSFTGVSTDSRTVKKGDCFFAIVGENFDGHDYIEDVLKKGAVCAVVSRHSNDKRRATSDEKRIVKVDDTIQALGDLAHQYRKRAGYKVVAITGSVGKTTTRQITHHVLSKHFKTHQSPKSFNNNIGLPFTLLNAPKGTEIVIAEIGTNHPGEIAYLTNIASPDIAAVINVHPAHLEGFGNLDAIVKEKMSISEGLLSDGKMIINSDFEQLVDFCNEKNINFTSFGKNPNADIAAKNISFLNSSSSFTIDDVLVELPLPGPGNVENALAAWTICKQFGLSVNDFAKAAKTFSGNVMRSEVMQIGNLTVLNDCYNANPASMKNALDILSNMDSTNKRRLVFIFGDMAELGEHSESLHIKLGRQIAKANIDLILAIGKYSKIAAQEANKNAKKNLEIKNYKDTISACNKLHEIIKDYDIILVKGSRTARLEAAVDKLKEIYDNKQEALNSKPETSSVHDKVSLSDNV